MSIGIIGGTGLYDLPGLDDIREREVKTPFGNPSSPVLSGVVDGVELHFLARHGRGHTLLPSEVNYRANLYALKVVGAKWCLSVSAVGSLQEEFRPGQVLVPDQFIDRTKGRASTFFGEGIVGHVAFADPFCPVMREELFAVASQVAKERSTEAHNGGTYLCMEGPAFSTRAESHMYRSWGASIIGMTNLPEAKLAREAEIAVSQRQNGGDADPARYHQHVAHIARQLDAGMAKIEPDRHHHMVRHHRRQRNRRHDHHRGGG